MELAGTASGLRIRASKNNRTVLVVTEKFSPGSKQGRSRNIVPSRSRHVNNIEIFNRILHLLKAASEAFPSLHSLQDSLVHMLNNSSCNWRKKRGFMLPSELTKVLTSGCAGGEEELLLVTFLQLNDERQFLMKPLVKMPLSTHVFLWGIVCNW